MPVHSPGLYTYTVSHLCVFSCGRLVLMGQKNVFCICRNDIMASPQRVFGCVQLDHSSARRRVINLCNDMAFHRCALSCVFSGPTDMSNSFCIPCRLVWLWQILQVL